VLFKISTVINFEHQLT